MVKEKGMLLCRICLCALLWACAGASASAREARYLTGNAADVKVERLAGPALDLAGGSTDVVPAIQLMINQVRGCDACEVKVDVVVLRSSGADGYNPLISALDGVDSVETLVITSRADADSPGVGDTVRRAEVVFFAGGDQCNYVRYFKGTEVERGVERVYGRGGGVGGTSAGLAIQGEIVYDACSGGSAKSFQTLRNPFHADVSFTENFFRWRYMKDTITDTHFAARDRMGRLLAFIARQLVTGRRKRVLGVAVDEKTSVVVDKNGLGRVVGANAAYFILGDHRPEVCAPGLPLTYSNFKIWKVPAGATFNFKQRPTEGFYLVSVERGKITTNPYEPPR